MPTAIAPNLPSNPVVLAKAAYLKELTRNAALVRRAMQQADDLVIVFDYLGSNGSLTRRVVSPIRFAAVDRFLALCLAREEPRQFYLDRCQNLRIDLASNYVMPVELVVLNPTSEYETNANNLAAVG